MTDWPSRALADCAEIGMGQSPPGKSVSELGSGLPFLQGNAEFGVEHPAARFQCDRAVRRAKRGDILISVRAPVGALNVADRAYGVGRGLATIRFAEADARYGYHVLRFAAPSLHRFSQGTTFAAIGRRELAGLRVPFPEPPERRRIAEVLDTIDDVIASSENLVEKLVSTNSGLIDSGLDDLLVSSTMRPLSSVAKVGGGLALSSKKAVVDPVSVPYLRVANVQDGFIDLSEIKTVTISGRDLDRFALKSGDVLMNEGGDFDKLGRGAVWDGSIEPCLHQNHVFRVRCNPHLLLPKYLALYAASRRGKKYFVSSSKQTTNLASINKAQLERFPVPVVDVDQQRSFVALVEEAERRLDTERGHLDKLRRVRVGLATDLLTGRARTGLA